MLKWFGVVLLLGTAAPVMADCLDAGSIDKGVTFRRSDGHRGTAIRKGDQIVIDYAAENGVREDLRWAVSGIYEEETSQLLIDEPSMGAGSFVEHRKFAGALPVPVAGQNWLAKVRLHRKTDNPSIDPKDLKDQDFRMRVTYHFLPEITGAISGCQYRAIPVEGRITDGSWVLTQRWLYFPDLGFGLETKRDGVTAKVVAMTTG